MDNIKLAQRTIEMLSSMIESGECHTTRSKEMKDNALNGLEQLRQHFVSGYNADSDKLIECSNCGDKVEMISSGEICPHCFC